MKPFPGIKVNFNTSHYWLVLKRQYIATLLGVLLLVVTALVAIVGYYTYGSLSEIVNRLETDEQPNQNLLLYKEILINLQGMENSVEAYQLSQTQRHLRLYDVYVANVSDYLDSLNRSNARDKEIRKLNDSLTSLINRKTDLLLQIIQLDVYANEASLESLNEVFTVADSATVQADTLEPETTANNETAEKKGLLKRIFGKKEEPSPTNTQPSVADSNPDSLLMAQRDRIRSELQEKIQLLQASRQGQMEQKRLQKMQLEESHFLVQTQILELVAYLESRETVKLQIRSLNARELAARTNEQMVIFFGLAIALLTLSIGMMVVYVRKSRSYQLLLRQSQEATEALAKAKERFFANMSHELRTPLNAITGFTKLLLRSPMSPQQHEQLTMVHQSGEHLLRIVNDLLDFSKLQAEKLRLENHPFQLEKVCVECAKLLHESAIQKNLHLKQEIDLPSAWVVGDPFRLRQILLNLLSNAIKYTETGEVVFRVTGEKQDQKLIAHLIVQDTGVGISAEDQERLFREFEQAGQSSFSKGTGLGLAITKKLVILHGGEITLESEPGRGTTVRLSLAWPLTEVPPANTETPVLEPQALPRLHALIADDEPFNIKLLAALLETWGVSYIACTDGQEALAAARLKPFDILLLDLKMPRLNGWEVIRAIRQNDGPNQTTPALALTATAESELNEPLEEGLFQQILIKPVDETTLYKVLASLPVKESSPESDAQTITVDLSTLMKTGDPAFVADMVDTFVSGAEAALEEMKQALEAGHFQQVSMLAHRTVAPARHFKAQQLVSLLKDLEKRADQQDITLHSKDLELLEHTLRQTIRALQQALHNQQ